MINGVEVDISVSIGVALSNPMHPLEAHGRRGGARAAAQRRRGDVQGQAARPLARASCSPRRCAPRRASASSCPPSSSRRSPTDQLRLAYQPIISTHSGRMVGAEALLRWDHPDRGLLLPCEFLHLAEESGAIVPIGDWVIRQACQRRPGVDRRRPRRAHVQRARQRQRAPADGRRVRRAGHRHGPRARPLPQQLTLDFDESTLYDDQPRRPAPCRRCAGSACSSPSTASAPACRRSPRCASIAPTCSSSTDRSPRSLGARRRQRPDRALDHPARPRARHAGRRRVGHRRRPAAPPAGARLRHGAGLPVRRAVRGRHLRRRRPGQGPLSAVSC